jgi:hypothetical protein
MLRLTGVALAACLLAGCCRLARADDAEAKAIIDKAIKALGGEEKLGKLKAYTFNAKCTASAGEGRDDICFTFQETVQGLDHRRIEKEVELGGVTYKGVTILAGDKGWRQIRTKTTELDKDDVAAEKRSLYLDALPATLLPLKDKAFKLEAAGEQKVGGQPAVGVKATGPDGKDFTLFFDKESGLPVKLAWVFRDFGQDGRETTFADYKDFDGVKKATKIETKCDGEKYLSVQLTEFKVLDIVDPKTFEEPK